MYVAKVQVPEWLMLLHAIINVLLLSYSFLFLIFTESNQNAHNGRESLNDLTVKIADLGNACWVVRNKTVH